MNIDKLPTPFVSDDLISRCLEDLEDVWNCTEYEQLLIEWRLKADEKAESEGTKNMRLRYDAVVKCLNQLEAAAGDNKDWWEQWSKDEDTDDPLIIDPYSNIDIAWYQKNITLFKVKTAIQFSIYLLKDAERPWNEADRAVFFSNKLIQLCYKLCEWVGIDTVLSTGGKNLVILHLKALSLYIALRNELNKLKEEAALYGIPFEKIEKPKPEEETKQEQQTEQEDDRWDTPRARKYFKKAIKAGLMEQTEDEHYRWKRSKKNPKAALGYFLQKVYNPDGCQQIPYKSLEKLFGEKRLDSTIGSLIYSEYSEKQQPWKKPIDDLFDD